MFSPPPNLLLPPSLAFPSFSPLTPSLFHPFALSLPVSPSPHRVPTGRVLTRIRGGQEKELAVRLGVPQREAACLLAESSFDVDQTVLVGLRRRAQLVQSADKLTAAVDILDVVKTKGDAGWSVCAEGECGGVAGGAGGRLGLGLAEQECPVCFDVVSDKDAMYKEALHGCRHFACDQCLFGHVRVRVMDEGDVSLLVCPAESCRARIRELPCVVSFLGL